MLEGIYSLRSMDPVKCECLHDSATVSVYLVLVVDVKVVCSLSDSFALLPSVKKPISPSACDIKEEVEWILTSWGWGEPDNLIGVPILTALRVDQSSNAAEWSLCCLTTLDTRASVVRISWDQVWNVKAQMKHFATHFKSPRYWRVISSECRQAMVRNGCSSNKGSYSTYTVKWCDKVNSECVFSKLKHVAS